LLRPLLQWGRETLLDYVKKAGCDYVVDPHNDDERYDRVFLRESVLPLLRTRWPGLMQSTQRSIAHIAAAESLLTDLARLDRRYTDGWGARIRLSRLSELSLPRRRNLLRAWIRDAGWRAPPARRLDAFLDACASPRHDSAATLEWDGGAVRRFGDRLYLVATALPLPPVTEQLRPEAPLTLPAGLGQLLLADGSGDAPGIRAPADGFRIRFRQGGERLKLPGRSGRTSVKALLREAGIVPWMRSRIPLLYRDEDLVGVGDLWVCDGARGAAGGQKAWKVCWSEHPPLH